MKFNFPKYKAATALFFNKPEPSRNGWAFVITLTFALTILLHVDALNGYWRFDDGAHLMFATEYSPWQYFFDPAITRAQSGANVTPWNIFFYDLNLSIFGFEPGGFYLHVLLLITSTALALYALLRLWLPLLPSILGIIIFLTGKPTYHLTQELMSSHYLTGMLFSLLSLKLFVDYIRHGKRIKLLTAILFYALAMTCKEVYVPLIALLFVIPAGNFKQRLSAIFPFALVAMGYALWRHQVLGAWIGGYKPSTGNLDYLVEIQQFTNIPFLLFNDHGWGLTGLIIILTMSLIAAWNRLLNTPLVVASIVILFTPLIPLTLYPGISQPGRYLFALWTATSIWIAVIFQAVNHNNETEVFKHVEKIIKSFAALVLIIASSLGLTNEKQHFKYLVHKNEKIYHFAIDTNFSKKALIFNSDDDGIYWASVSSKARSAYDFSKNLIPQPPLFIVDNLNGLLLFNEITLNRRLDLSSIQFYHYHNNSFIPIDIKTIINSKLSALKAGKDQVLQVEFKHSNGFLSWRFQPKGLTYSPIIWQGITGLESSIFELPEKGSYKWEKNNEIQISISFESPKGWIGITPKFRFDPLQGRLDWQGKSDVSLISGKLESLLFRIKQVIIDEKSNPTITHKP